MYLLSNYMYIHYLLLSIRIFPPTSSLESLLIIIIAKFIFKVCLLLIL